MSSDEPQPHTAQAPPGDQLRRARKQAGLSLEEAARELRMPENKLAALEADDYSQLRVDTFVRGYLRAYAKLLELDPAPLLAAYREYAGEFASEDQVHVDLPEGVPQKPTWLLVVYVLIILVVLWLVSVWFLGQGAEPQGSPEPAPELEEEPAEAPSPAPDESADAASPPNEPESAADAQSAAAPADPVEQTSEPEADLRDVQPLSAAPPTGESDAALDRLGFEFTDECWLEVSDARGDVLYTDLQRAGNELELRGQAPFNVRMGNAAAVQMTLNGEPVAIERQSDQSVVSMTVEH